MTGTGARVCVGNVAWGVTAGIALGAGTITTRRVMTGAGWVALVAFLALAAMPPIISSPALSETPVTAMRPPTAACFFLRPPPVLDVGAGALRRGTFGLLGTGCESRVGRTGISAILGNSIGSGGFLVFGDRVTRRAVVEVLAEAGERVGLSGGCRLGHDFDRG